MRTTNAAYRKAEDRTHKGVAKKQGEDVSQGHVSFHMMLNMQLGTRICVGMTRPRRPLAPQDFTYAYKLELPRSAAVVLPFIFPMWTLPEPSPGYISSPLSPTRLGSSRTPPHQSYDFKFKDYAPMVFRELREHFGVNKVDYLVCCAPVNADEARGPDILVRQNEWQKARANGQVAARN